MRKKKKSTLKIESFGFRLLETRKLPLAFDSTAFLYRHLKTGARLVHLANDDKIGGYITAFGTVPSDNTGLSHSSEHSVLAGSKKHKGKDPFFSLLKGGLTEFCNAFTGSDITMYPFCVKKEGYLKTLGVYLDSMFLPNLSEDTFRQEAHRFAFDKEDNLIIKGVVYEEMKGAFSSLNSLIVYKCLRGLFPDNAYGYESGGNPESIPDSKHEDMIEFHKKFYHPSNSTTITYGSIPIAKVLESMNGYLSKFDKQDLDIDKLICNQPWWKKPETFFVDYPIDKKESDKDKYAVVVSFRGPDALKTTDVLAMKVLEKILLGHSGAILRKALADSGLGKRIAGSGLDTEQKENIFTVGLDGVKKGKEKNIAKIIFSVFGELSEKGIDKDEVASAIHQLSIDIKSIESIFRAPYFLKIAFDALETSFYGSNRELLDSLDIRIALKKLEKMSDGKLLKKVLEKYLLKNTHHSVTIFKPSKKLSEEQEMVFENKMAKIKNEMSQEQITAIKKMNEDLERKQSAPEAPEALAEFPKLTLEEMPDRPDEFDTEKIVINNIDILNTPAITNGQVYCNFGLGVNNLKPELVPFIPLFTEAWEQMGTATIDYVKMSKKVNTLGNIELSPNTYGHIEKSKNYASLLLIFSISSPTEKFAELMKVLREKINDFDPTDEKRLKQILDNFESSLANQIVSSGDSFALRNAKSGLSAGDRLDEKLSGLEQLSFLRKIQKEFTADPWMIIDKMIQIKNFAKKAYDYVLFSVVSDDDTSAVETIKQFVAGQKLSLGKHISRYGKSWEINLEKQKNACYPLSPSSSFVAKAFLTPEIDDCTLNVLSLALARGRLHTKIREQGGAYGARCFFDQIDHIWKFVTFRDPNIARTLRIYDEIFDYVLEDMDLSESELTKKVINALNKYNPVIYSGKISETVFNRQLMGVTPQYRERFWNGIKKVDAMLLKTTARLLKEQMTGANISVISSRQKIEKENKTIPNPLEIVEM